MALRIFQFGIVFAIGYYLGPASPFAGTAGVPEVPLLIDLKDPKDVTVGRGQSARLQCEATSSESTLQITWLHNDQPIKSNDTKRHVLDDGSLYIPKIGGKKNNGLTGDYRCKATSQPHNVSVLSNPAKLRIASFGEFIRQPTNLSVPESQPAVLFCNIHSVPSAQIKWEQNTKPLPHNRRYVPLPSGALLITKTHSSDAGSYSCIATNSLLKKTKRSKIVELTVSSSPMKTLAPTFLPLDILPNTTVLVGGNINLYCAVTGWPIPTVQWLNNNSIVISNSSTLQFRNVTLQHTGNYTCKVSNVIGTTEKLYTIQVYQKPFFNVTPASKAYPPARTVRLDCKAEGVPKPKISWFKNGEPLKDEARIKRQPTGLVFSHTFTIDSGIYQCFATNAAGKIWAAARMIHTSSNTPSPPEDVQCRPYDETSVCLTWQCPRDVDVANVRAYSIYSYYRAEGSVKPGPEFVTNTTYQLATGLNMSTNYTFYVRLYSKSASDGSLEVTCKTGVTGKRNLQVQALNETCVQLTWSKVSSDVPCDTSKEFYKVQWKRKGRSSGTSNFTRDLSYIVSGLSFATEYEFRVVSTWQKNDMSPWVAFTMLDNDDTTKLTNGSDLIPVAPEKVEASIVSATSINLTWLDNNENTKYYTICVVDVKKQDKCNESELRRSVSSIVQIDDLQSETLYGFRVKAHSSEGYFSQYSQLVEIRTPADVPSKVLNLNYRALNESSVCLYWQAPLRKNGKLLKYLVSYTPNNDWPLDNWLNKSVLTEQNKGCWLGDDQTFSTILYDLQPEKDYTVYVRAVSEIGTGNPSYPIKLNTNTLTNVGEPDLQDDVQYNQKLGIIMGITISLTCIIFCISCILVRKRCLKTRAFTRARMAASNNYYPAVAHYASEGSSVQVRLENPCSAEIHEIEHLVGDDTSNHIPAVTPAHLDTKGTDGYPNGHINGSAKPYINGHIANGIVHITENPRYYVLECNGHVANKKPKPQEMFEEDSNSNLKTSKFHDLHQIFENSKKDNKPCNFHSSRASASSSENSLNSTQLTCLDNSFVVNRKVSPVLGPNG